MFLKETLKINKKKAHIVFLTLFSKKTFSRNPMVLSAVLETEYYFIHTIIFLTI